MTQTTKKPTPKSPTKKQVFKEMITQIGMDIDHKQFEIIKYAVDHDKPALLIGESGTGKTSMIQEYGRSVGKKVYRINLNGQTGTEDILGRWTLKGEETVWVDGLLIKAMKEGAWIIFDEINAAHPDVLFVLHSLLDHDKKITLVEKESDTVTAHKDFRFFATMNPSDRYTGTKSLNIAFKSRFPVVINVSYSPNEVGILTEKTKISKQHAQRLVAIGQSLRAMYQADTINYPCSTRDLLYTADIIKQTKSVPQAITFGILNKFDADEKEAVHKAIELLIDEKITIGGKKYTDFSKVLEKAQEMNDEIKKLNKKVGELYDEGKELRVKYDDATNTLQRKEEEINILNQQVAELKSVTQEKMQQIIDAKLAQKDQKTTAKKKTTETKPKKK